MSKKCHNQIARYHLLTGPVKVINSKFEFRNSRQIRILKIIIYKIVSDFGFSASNFHLLPPVNHTIIPSSSAVIPSSTPVIPVKTGIQFWIPDQVGNDRITTPLLTCEVCIGLLQKKLISSLFVLFHFNTPGMF